MAISFILSILLSFNLNSYHGDDPVSWDFSIIPLENNEFEFVAKATMKTNWVVYSQKNSGDGPVPTTVDFNENSDITFIETEVLETGELISVFDELFETQVNKYKHEVVFSRKFKSSVGSGNLSGYIEYMTCDGLRCLPPKPVDFDLKY